MNRLMNKAQIQCPVVMGGGDGGANDNNDDGETAADIHSSCTHFDAKQTPLSPSSPAALTSSYTNNMRALFSNCFFNITIAPAAVDGTVASKARTKAVPLKGTAFGIKVRVGKVSAAASASISPPSASHTSAAYVHFPTSSVEATAAVIKGLAKSLVPNTTTPSSSSASPTHTAAADGGCQEGNAVADTTKANATAAGHHSEEDGENAIVKKEDVDGATTIIKKNSFAEALDRSLAASPLATGTSSVFSNSLVTIHRPTIIVSSSSSPSTAVTKEAETEESMAMLEAGAEPSPPTTASMQLVRMHSVASMRMHSVASMQLVRVVNFNDEFEKSLAMLLKRNTATSTNTTVYKASETLPMATHHHTHHRHCVIHRQQAATRRSDLRKQKNLHAKLKSRITHAPHIVNIIPPTAAAATASASEMTAPPSTVGSIAPYAAAAAVAPEAIAIATTTAAIEEPQHIVISQQSPSHYHPQQHGGGSASSAASSSAASTRAGILSAIYTQQSQHHFERVLDSISCSSSANPPQHNNSRGNGFESSNYGGGDHHHHCQQYTCAGPSSSSSSLSYQSDYYPSLLNNKIVLSTTNGVSSSVRFRHNPYATIGFNIVVEENAKNNYARAKAVPAAAEEKGRITGDESNSNLRSSHQNNSHAAASSSSSAMVPVSSGEVQPISAAYVSTDPRGGADDDDDTNDTTHNAAAAASPVGYLASYLPQWVVQPGVTALGQYMNVGAYEGLYDVANDASARLKNMLTMSKVKRF